MMRNKLVLIIGQFSLFIGFVGFWANYFYFERLIIYFFFGILFGFSLIFNLTFLLKNRK